MLKEARTNKKVADLIENDEIVKLAPVFCPDGERVGCMCVTAEGKFIATRESDKTATVISAGALWEWLMEQNPGMYIETAPGVGMVIGEG